MKNMIIYPGSFDPITLGHFDLIQRAARMTDHLVVAVLQNPNKRSFFTIEERVEMLKKCTKDLPNVTIDCSGGLLVDYINILRLDGVSKQEALVEAGVTRMRPILITAITTNIWRFI